MISRVEISPSRLTVNGDTVDFAEIEFFVPTSFAERTAEASPHAKTWGGRLAKKDGTPGQRRADLPIPLDTIAPEIRRLAAAKAEARLREKIRAIEAEILIWQKVIAP